jgi:hypothetical protein
MKTILVTFGCSWTYGVGVGYRLGMTEDDYEKISHDIDICSDRSFRGILSNRHNLQNINFAQGGSSNQQQFRLLKNFLSSNQFQQLTSNGTKIIILHGITSTARNEMYFNERKSLVNFKYDDVYLKKWTSFIIKHFYNHDNEVARLAEEMKFMNQYYASAGINNLWFDTFNHHQYPLVIDNLISNNDSNRDFLSYLASVNGFSEVDNNYHLSSWKIDCDRVEFLVDRGYLNPISKHPTKQGHELIADLVSTYIEKII